MPAKSYSEIIACIKSDMDRFDSSVSNAVEKYKNELSGDLRNFLSQGSKRLRIVLIFLITRALGSDVTENQMQLANGIELMHNASLLHDDVVDNAKERRKKKSFNAIYDNTISIIGGDYMLSLAMENFMNLANSEILQMFLNTLKTLCEGEIYQYFHKNMINSIEEYIEKSYKKTAILYETAVCSAAILANANDIQLSAIKNFIKNFGIAFQLRDDFINIYNSESSTDIEEGVFTAPVIYAAEDFPNIANLEKSEILKIVKNKKYEQMTRALTQKYIDSAIENLSNINENEYKKALLELCYFLEV